MDRLLWKERERALSANQWTFSFLKTESLKQRIAGEVITRLEKKGLIFSQLKLHPITKAEAEELYSVHRRKSFFPELGEHVTSVRVLVMVLEGLNAVEIVRRVVGGTNPLLAEPG